MEYNKEEIEDLFDELEYELSKKLDHDEICENIRKNLRDDIDDAGNSDNEESELDEVEKEGYESFKKEMRQKASIILPDIFGEEKLDDYRLKYENEIESTMRDKYEEAFAEVKEEILGDME